MPLQGPDGSLVLQRGNGLAAQVVVPPQKRLNLQFRITGYNENCMIVYLRDTLQEVVERGNYDRSQDFWQSHPKLTDEAFIIAGFNKESPPDGGKPWRQSTCTVEWNYPTLVCSFHDLGPDSLGGIVEATISD